MGVLVRSERSANPRKFVTALVGMGYERSLRAGADQTVGIGTPFDHRRCRSSDPRLTRISTRSDDQDLCRRCDRRKRRRQLVRGAGREVLDQAVRANTGGEKELIATVLKQAEIERQRIETLAEAEKSRLMAEAEGHASAPGGVAESSTSRPP